MHHGVVGPAFGIVLLRVPHVGQHQMAVEQQGEVPLLLRADLALAGGLRDGNEGGNVQDRGDPRVLFAHTDAVRVEAMLKGADLSEEWPLVNAPVARRGARGKCVCVWKGVIYLPSSSSSVTSEIAPS